MKQFLNRLAISTVALMLSWCVYAQPNITRVEYYIDGDPGYGNATALSITAGTNLVNLAINIDPASLSGGVHLLGVRAKDANGAWSLDNRWLFAKPFTSDTTGPGPLPNITRVEYYIDGDPGYGSATALSITPGTNLSNITININPANIGSGVHILGVRAKDANGVWSHDNRWLFAKPFASDTTGPGPLPNITRVEYYLDTDPGYGNATALSTGTGNNLPNISLNIDPAALTEGVHLLGVRAKDANGVWSHDNKWLFARPYASDTTGPGPVANLKQIEYYIDTDPGYGKGIQLAQENVSNIANLSVSVNISGLAAGGHSLYIRSKDANNAWSLDNKWDFTVSTATNAASIAVNSISKKTMCAGDALSVGYDAKGTYNSGNTFTVQLSDGSGSFSSPTAIGSVTSQAKNGIINCTPPSTLLTGTGYKVRVVSSSNAVTGTTGTDAITINALPPVPTITASGPTVFCQGGSVTLTSSSATADLWNTGATTQSITVSTSGNYTVTVKNASGCTNVSAATTVTVNPLPTATITAGGPTTFCQGGSVTLTASAASSYLWSTGATTQSINVSTAGNYTVTVTNANGCSKTSAATAVTVNPLPTATITAGGPTTFCQGGSVTLTASAGSSYLWSTGATTQSINVSTAGNYTVTVTNANGCSKTSAATTVIVNPLPTAIITAGGPITFCQGGSVTLTASAGTSYLWSNGATTQSINVSTAGSYTVTVTNANGCSATSAATAVTVNTNPTPTTNPSGTVNIVSPNTVTISAVGTYSSYLWSNGATTSSITVGTTGNYSVTVTNASGCSGTSAPVVVNVGSGCTKPTITPSGSTSNVCPGKTNTLTSSSAASYLWSTGATTQSIVVSAAGSYTVTTGTGCTSDPVVVTYQPCVPPTSLTTSNIAATGARISWTAAPCAVGYQYQWRKKGTTTWTTATTTATNRNITGLTASTIYQWRVLTGCKITPDTVASVNATGPEFTTLAAAASPNVSIKQQISNGGSLTAKLFPNPAHDQATLQLTGSVKNATIRLTDMTGKTLWESKNVNSNELQIPVSKFSNGTYLITINGGTSIVTLKLVKE